MTHIIIILVFMVISGIYWYYQENKENNQTIVTNMEETISTRQLALKTIENIGSEPKYNEEGRIQFEYQGVIFLMEAVNNCMFVNLIWPWCHSFSKFDIDEFARVRQVVNEINVGETVSVIYTISDSDDVALHIKKHFLLVQQIPEVEEYLKQILNSFYRTARTLELEIEKFRMKKETDKNTSEIDYQRIEMITNRKVIFIDSTQLDSLDRKDLSFILRIEKGKFTKGMKLALDYDIEGGYEIIHLYHKTSPDCRYTCCRNRGCPIIYAQLTCEEFKKLMNRFKGSRGS